MNVKNGHSHDWGLFRFLSAFNFFSMSNSDMSQILAVGGGLQAVAQCEVGRPGGWSLVILSMKQFEVSRYINAPCAWL